MKLGIAAVASNAIKWDYHLEEFVKWHAAVADELVINTDPSSDDDTLHVLQYMQKHYSNLRHQRYEKGRRH